MRTDDLFGAAPEVVFKDEPANNAPLSTYLCPDGAVRLVSSDPKVSPYGNGRDPLYVWDVDPDAGFAVSNRRVIYDCVKADVGIPLEQVPRVDMCKILPHTGGRAQYVVHRVRSKATNDPKKTGKAITQAEKDACAVYYAKIHYPDRAEGQDHLDRAVHRAAGAAMAVRADLTGDTASSGRRRLAIASHNPETSLERNDSQRVPAPPPRGQPHHQALGLPRRRRRRAQLRPDHDGR
jgi:hypothetical protein